MHFHAWSEFQIEFWKFTEKKRDNLSGTLWLSQEKKQQNITSSNKRPGPALLAEKDDSFFDMQVKCHVCSDR